MKIKVLGGALMLAAFAIMLACQPPSTPTPPTNVSQVVIVGPNNSGNGSGGSQDAACAGITGTPALTVFSGTFSGGKGKVGEPMLMRIEGLSIPSSCTPTVNVDASGACVRLGSVQTVSQIMALPTSAGTCAVTACVAGVNPQKCAGNATQVIE